MRHILKYSHPAGEFKNGLPIGNGRLAAMVCGDGTHVRLALNHEWLWRGVNRARDCEDVSEKLGEVRERLFADDFREGTRLANEFFAGKGGISGERNRVDPYQPAGDLTVTVPGGAYARTLDLETGEAVVRAGATEVRAFASFADGFIVIKITGPGEVGLSRVSDPMCELTAERLRLSGRFRGGVAFEVDAREYRDAEADRGGDGREGTVTVLADIATDANRGKLLDFPDKADYDELFRRHLPAFAGARGNAELLIRGTDPVFKDPEAGEAFEAPDTDVRLERFRAGKDPELAALYFEYGRYLMVSGSSGELPLNLQGKWNEDLDPPWECDYHLDVNLQMAYWPADALGLTRQQDTLFNLCDRYRPHGREMARKLYGCGGVFFTLQTDVWGRMTPESKGWAVWIGAAPWLASHFTRRWHYTRSREFLETRAYPFLKEVAAFYADYLVERDGAYHIAPSQSPENRFAEAGGEYPVAICVDAAMDVELAADTFRACIEMAEALGVDPELRGQWRKFLAGLPPLTTDSAGRLNEFGREFTETEPGHRHLSHLYGLYPGEMFPEGDPLRAACERSLDSRLSHGGGHTGWSRSWVACLMARLGRAADCWQHLTALICDFATESLLDLHPPRIFQIDGNMGGCAAVCEMLLSCEGDRVRLLGALPAAWPSGEFRHFKAPGTLDVSCRWSGGNAECVVLHAEQAGEWQLCVGDNIYSIALGAGETRTINF
ncbi:MAG: glycoside hydrolase N-terminal domain-containing protein [Clostridia bacterium]|nr:glycoside hydrolase N-terminal domain-containing protein [Clostridia bacterium]